MHFEKIHLKCIQNRFQIYFKIHLTRMHLKQDKLENAKCISWKYINPKNIFEMHFFKSFLVIFFKSNLRNVFAINFLQIYFLKNVFEMHF